MTGRIVELLRALGARIVNNWIWRLGFACRFLWFTLKESGPSFRRFHGVGAELSALPSYDS